MDDLHISKRLKAILPALEKEDLEQLERNIESDGEIIDPIIFWNDGKRNVVLDGMHRLAIAKKMNLAFSRLEIKIDGGYDEAALWILDHALGQRNIKPSVIRTIRGKLYNQLKRKDGGHGSQKAECQNDTPLKTAAEKASEIAGVSESTVKRDGARVEAIESITKPAQAIADRATDAEIKRLAKLDPGDQTKVARMVRVGQAGSVSDALKLIGKDGSSAGKPEESDSRTPRKGKDKPADLGKCPNCAGTKWKEDNYGTVCAKCLHPHGESAGDVDADRVNTQRQKTVKTIEALMRAFDDLHLLLARPDDHKYAVDSCKALLKTARAWK